MKRLLKIVGIVVLACVALIGAFAIYGLLLPDRTTASAVETNSNIPATCIIWGNLFKTVAKQRDDGTTEAQHRKAVSYIDDRSLRGIMLIAIERAYEKPYLDQDALERVGLKTCASAMK